MITRSCASQRCGSQVGHAPLPQPGTRNGLELFANVAVKESVRVGVDALFDHGLLLDGKLLLLRVLLFVGERPRIPHSLRAASSSVFVVFFATTALVIVTLLLLITGFVFRSPKHDVVRLLMMLLVNSIGSWWSVVIQQHPQT